MTIFTVTDKVSRLFNRWINGSIIRTDRQEGV